VPHSVESLIDRQIRRSEVLRRAQGRAPTPCIALSRPVGAGATEIGQKLAARLGYEFLDRQILDRIANASHARRQLVEALDEKARAGIERYAAELFRREVFHENDYLRWLVDTLVTLAEHGGAVILGRGAQFILPLERTLRVLVVAPAEDRARRLAQKESLSPADAARRVELADRERSEFARQMLKFDPDDASRYDIAVNTATLGIDGATELVLRAFERRFPGLGAPAAHG
jgi:cytidylate kinase